MVKLLLWLIQLNSYIANCLFLHECISGYTTVTDLVTYQLSSGKNHQNRYRCPWRLTKWQKQRQVQCWEYVCWSGSLTDHQWTRIKRTTRTEIRADFSVVKMRNRKEFFGCKMRNSATEKTKRDRLLSVAILLKQISAIDFIFSVMAFSVLIY